MTNERKEMIRTWLVEAMEDETFCQAISQTQTTDEASKVFASFGLDIRPEEIEEMAQEGQSLIQQSSTSDTDELSPEELEAVVGGGKFLRFLGVTAFGGAAGFVAGMFCFAVPAASPFVAKAAIGYSALAAVYVSRG